LLGVQRDPLWQELASSDLSVSVKYLQAVEMHPGVDD